MKYIKNFETFRTEYKREDELNEEIIPFITNLFKNFINAIAAPFKKFRNNFMKADETPAQKKEKLIRVIEEMSKVAKNNMDKAKEEEELQQILEKFIKQIEEEIKKFEIEIKNIKESKIFEAEESAAAADPGRNTGGAVAAGPGRNTGGNDAPQNKPDDKKTENAPDDKKTENAPDDKKTENAPDEEMDKLDTGLLGKIALELLKNYFRGNDPLKLRLDAKISQANTLPKKILAYKQKLDGIVGQFKKDIQEKGKIENLTAEYKKKNKIKDQTEIEDKTGKEDENKISDEILKSYGDDIDSLEDLMDKKIRYKRDGYDDNKKPEQQPKLWANGMITSIDDDDEDDITIKILNNKNKKTYEKRPGDILPSQTNKGKNKDKDKSEEDSESQTEVKEILGKTKKNPEKMKRFGNILKSLDADEDKIAQVQKALGLDKKGAQGQKGQGQGQKGQGQGQKRQGQGQGQDQDPSK